MLKTKTVGIVALALVALLTWQSGVGRQLPGDSDDDGRDHYSLIMKSSELKAYVTAEVTTSESGEIIHLDDVSKDEPWEAEFAVEQREYVQIRFHVVTQVPRVKNYTGFSRCEIYKNGHRIKMNRGELTFRGQEITYVRASCPYHND